jgi:hypothetical protein
MLKKFDLFARHYVLPLDGQLKYKSAFGGIFTVFTIFATLTLVYVLGIEIILRKSPSDLLQIETSPIPKSLIFNISNAFLIVDSMSSYIKDFDKYLQFEANYHWLKNSDGIFYQEPNYPEKILSRACEISDFHSNLEDQFNLMALNKAFCFSNQSKELFGDFSGDTSKYLNMIIRPCINTTENNFKCKSHEEIKKFLMDNPISISFHYSSIQYDAKNYSEPLKSFIREDNYVLSYVTTKYITYTVQEFNVISNIGIIWDFFTSIKAIQFDKIKHDFYFREKEKNFEELIFAEFMFLSSTNTIYHYRKYIRISEIIAHVGGILKIYIIFSEFFFYYFYHNRMNEFIFSKIFNITKYDLELPSTDIIKIIQTKEGKSKKVDEKIDNKYNPNIKLNQSKLKNSHIYFSSSNNLILKNNQTNEIINKLNENNMSNFNPISNVIPKKIANLKLNLDSSTSDYLKSRKVGNNKIEYVFSSFEKLSTLICCKAIQPSYLKLKYSHYNNLSKLTKMHVDVLKIIENLMDVSKLKYILFNKKQLAIFNSINYSYSHFQKKELSNWKILKRLRYESDKEAMNEKISEFLQLKQEEILNNNINRRLFENYATLYQSNK